jgi:hypothetical protein
MRASFACAFVWVAGPLVVMSGHVGAQGSDVDEGAVQARLPRQLQCLEAAQERTTATVRLLREALVQMRSAKGPQVRRDAARAAVSLEGRLRELAADMAQCVPADAEARPVAYVEASADPTADAVAQENPATHVVERDRKLGPYLRVELGEQVDGTGRLAPGVVRDGVTRLASPLHGCYERLARDGLLPQGKLVILFTVTPRGDVQRVRVEEDTVGGPAFARCVTHQARRALRVAGRPTGGAATFSYSFRVGPSR